MITKNDIDLIEEYEELIVLLRQLHDDVPILEKQHNSIKKAFKKEIFPYPNRSYQSHRY